ncbi:MAG: dual specificity protein phosphatase family protein [Chloroflexi bacterium]|nr:dual specificity protein phosphatase family protein [Chloroflexota bacterium]
MKGSRVVPQPETLVTPIYGESRSEGRQHVWQTGSVAARDLDRLRAAAPQCGRLVVVAGYRVGWAHRADVPETHVFQLNDALRGADPAQMRELERAWRCVEAGWRSGQDVVVACEIGAYRSAGVILCWLTRARGLSLEAGVELLDETRGAAIGRSYRETFGPANRHADGFFGQVVTVCRRTRVCGCERGVVGNEAGEASSQPSPLSHSGTLTRSHSDRRE